MDAIKQKETILFNILGYFTVTTFGLMCVLPFILVVSGSFTAESVIYKQGYSLFPSEISLEAYKFLLSSPEKIIRAYGVTILVTGLGTTVGLLITTMTAYVLFRKDFPWRNKFAFFFYFTTLFNGGMVPTYIIMIRYLHVKNNPVALILPHLLTVFYILIMRNFIKGSVPDSLMESAKIDGAGDFRIYYRIILPLLTPALASIGLFISIQYWNDWSSAMLYMDKEKFYPLQYLLYRMISSVNFAQQVAAESGIPSMDLPRESVKLSMTVIATGPIVFAYPFVQKYFIRGITIGAVKG